MVTLHQLFRWHKPEYRVLYTLEDGTFVIACAKCSCPKDALGYTCLDRTYDVDGAPFRECGLWSDFAPYIPEVHTPAKFQ